MTNRRSGNHWATINGGGSFSAESAMMYKCVAIFQPRGQPLLHWSEDLDLHSNFSARNLVDGVAVCFCWDRNGESQKFHYEVGLPDISKTEGIQCVTIHISPNKHCYDWRVCIFITTFMSLAYSSYSAITHLNPVHRDIFLTETHQPLA